MDITQTGGAAPKRSASPTRDQLSTMLQPVSISRRSAAPSPSHTAEWGALPSEAQENVLSFLDPQDIISLGGTNSAHKALIKGALICNAVKAFVEKNNLTTPKGNPTDPDFLRSAIKEYVTRPDDDGELSEAMRADLKTSLSIYPEEVREAGAVQPLFSIHEILTQPYKAAEFTVLSGFFNDSRERVRQFQAIATAGGSNKILTHMRENPAVWRRLDSFRLNDTEEALNAGGEAAAFVKNNIDSWLQLASIKMQHTIDVLRTGGAAVEFVQNHPEAWLGLNAEQMWNTKEVLNAGGAVAEFVQNHTETWLGLNLDQMWRTIEAFNAGGAAPAFVEKNSEEWSRLNAEQMWFTTKVLNAGGAAAAFVQNHLEAWLGLNAEQMLETKLALNAGGALADFVEKNPETWSRLNAEQMPETKLALNAGGALADFVEKNPEEWCGFNVKEMHRRIYG